MTTDKIAAAATTATETGGKRQTMMDCITAGTTAATESRSQCLYFVGNCIQQLKRRQH